MRALYFFPAVMLAVASPGIGAEVEVNGLTGFFTDVDGAVDGRIISDQLSGIYDAGYKGELLLMPVDPAFLADMAPDAPGIVTGDPDGNYAGQRGLVAYCIDYTQFLGLSETPAETFQYSATGLATAESRYLSESVPHYMAGGLKKAAYLLEQHYAEAHAGGDIEAAALQAAIWEVLYDSSYDVGSGNYRFTVTSDPNHNTQANLAKNTANSWLLAANNAAWGGPAYDPTGRVLFWLDPENTDQNQSVITLIPEPGSLICGLAGLVLLGRRRR